MGCMLSRVCTPKSYNGKDVSFCVFAPYKKCKKGKNTCSFIQFNCLRHATASPSALVLPTLEHISTAIRAMLCSTSWTPSRNLNLGELIFPFSLLPPHFFFFLLFFFSLFFVVNLGGANATRRLELLHHVAARLEICETPRKLL